MRWSVDTNPLVVLHAEPVMVKECLPNPAGLAEDVKPQQIESLLLSSTICS